MELNSWSLKFALSLVVAALASSLLHGRHAAHAVQQSGMQ